MAADEKVQFDVFTTAQAAPEEAQDNGMADPADVELFSRQEEAAEELSFDEKLNKLGSTVTRHPHYREILYRTLGFCTEERLLHDVEQEIATYPEFPSCGQNQYFLINCLVKAYGLDFIERDDDGNVVTAQAKEGLTEDEIDDLVASYHYKTTEVGLKFLEEYSPKVRLVELLELTPERTDTYIEVLEFVAGGSRSMADIEGLLEGREIQTFINGRYETIKPSVFVDKLERAGALVWNSGWNLSEEGRSYLDELKAAQ